MEKRISYINIILILISVIIGSCEKPNSQNNNKTIDLETFYDSFKFKTGSYWIYEDSISKEIDSIYVIKVDSGYYWNPPPVHGGPGTRREFYKLTYGNTRNENNDTDLLESNGIRRNTESEWEICGRRYYTHLDYSGYTKVDSLFIQGTVFYDVVKKLIEANDHVSDCSNSGFENDIEFYTAPDYGIIKMVEFNNDSTKVWNLTRWKINK